MEDRYFPDGVSPDDTLVEDTPHHGASRKSHGLEEAGESGARHAIRQQRRLACQTNASLTSFGDR